MASSTCAGTGHVEAALTQDREREEGRLCCLKEVWMVIIF